MIQPLKSSRTSWIVYWLDLDEPVPAGRDFFLPTLLIICDSQGTPLGAPDVLEELDQIRVENSLLKLFDKLGPPERIDICANDEWDTEAWSAFSGQQQVEIRFRSFDQPTELQSLARTVVLRYAREEGSVLRAKDIAAGLVNTALRLRSPRKKDAMLRAALSRDPDCSAARIELADAEFQKGNWKASLSAYDEVIARDSSRWQDLASGWWSNRETRPFLRALYGRAMTLWHLGRHHDSARQFEALLARNPLDNQGVRFFIPLLYQLAEDFDTASAWYVRYARDYPRDYSEPSFLFGWGLSLYQDGHETEARLRYTEAILKNIYIAPMLLELPEPSRSLWHPNDRSEPSYAGEFIDSYAILWDREAGALRLLREAWEEAQPLVSRIVAHRENMGEFQDQRYEPDYKSLWQAMVEEDERLTSLPKNS